MDSSGKLRPSPAGLLNTREIAFDQRDLEPPPVKRPHSAPEREPTADDTPPPREAPNLERDFYLYYMRDRRDFHLEGRSGNSLFSPPVGTGVAQMRKDTDGSLFMLEKASRRPSGLPSGEEQKENTENEPEDSMAPLQESLSHRPLSLSALQNLPMIPLPTIVWSGGTPPVTDILQSSPELPAIRIPVTQPKKKTLDR